MISKILVAYDGSEGASAAFRFGLDLAKKYKAQLVALSIVEVPKVPEDVETEAIIESGKSHFENQLKTLKKQAKAEEINLETHIVVGQPADQIVHWAQEKHIDMIILGHHSRSLLGRWLLGSTSDRVMDHAACSVIVVKNNKAHG